MTVLPVIRLLPGREKSLLRKHPWIFSGAVDRVSDGIAPRSVCVVESAGGEKLALASYSPRSQIRGRVWSFNCDESIDRDFFRRRIAQAAKLRQMLGLDAPDGGCRLIFSESDLLPGVVADRYADFIALQILSAGAEFFREEIISCLAELPGIKGVYERSDVSIRKHENLAPRSGISAGAPPPENIIITENSMRFAVDPVHGQKTGFYFDLRDARTLVRNLPKRRRVLNVFSYTGGFAVSALLSRAEEVINIDSSKPALAQAQKNIQLNYPDDKNCSFIAGDGFEKLDELVSAREKFDLVILDPPKLIDSKNHLENGCRAYSLLARRGFELLNPGGMLLNLSCSGLMTEELFQKITSSAANQCGADAVIAAAVRQSPDHPVSLAVPETFYLNGLLSIRRN